MCRVTAGRGSTDYSQARAVTKNASTARARSIMFLSVVQLCAVRDIETFIIRYVVHVFVLSCALHVFIIRHFSMQARRGILRRAV